MGEREQRPSETAEQLGELAALAAALPQAFSQLSTLLEQALDTQVLSMAAASTETDPAMAIGVARLHLNEARRHAVDLHKLLDAAHQATVHVLSDGVTTCRNRCRGTSPDQTRSAQR
jgi:hypothetical protein